MSVSTTRLVLPKRIWLDCDFQHLTFPSLYCRPSSDPRDFEVCDRTATDERRLIVGASWGVLANTPNFLVRAAIFESLFFPYDIPRATAAALVGSGGIGGWRVAHGALLWHQVNLSAYADLQDRRRVYVRDPNSGRFYLRFTFGSHSIELVYRNPDESR